MPGQTELRQESLVGFVERDLELVEAGVAAAVAFVLFLLVTGAGDQIERAAAERDRRLAERGGGADAVLVGLAREEVERLVLVRAGPVEAGDDAEAGADERGVG